MAVSKIIVSVLVDVKLGYPAETVCEMICEIFGKEEMKENPRAKLILIEVEQK